MASHMYLYLVVRLILYSFAIIEYLYLDFRSTKLYVTQPYTIYNWMYISPLYYINVYCFINIQYTILYRILYTT